jgi:hypothetical protein
VTRSQVSVSRSYLDPNVWFNADQPPINPLPYRVILVNAVFTDQAWVWSVFTTNFSAPLRSTITARSCALRRQQGDNMANREGDLEKVMRSLDLKAAKKIGRLKGMMEGEDDWQAVGKSMAT